MPQKIKLEGSDEEIEVFTAEEVAAQTDVKAKEAAEAARVEEAERLNTEHEAALLDKEEELSTTKEKLEKLEKKDMNFENLRKSKTLTPEQEEAAKKNAEELDKLRGTVNDLVKAPLETARTSFLETNFDAADKDGREVWESYYKKLSIGAKTVEEVNKAAVAAFNAVNAGKRQPNLDGRMSRVNVNDNFDADKGGSESETSQEFGNMLGLTPEAKKKFAGVAKTGSIHIFAKNPPKP